MLKDLLLPFITIGLAELGDKTQLAVLLLSAKQKKHFQLFLGVLSAFIVVDGVAIFLGSRVINLVPINIVKIVSSIIFIIFGILILKESFSKNQENAGGSKIEKFADKNAFIAGFTLIFISEWADKTQIASALFAVNYNPWLVLAGCISALAALTLLAIYLGKFLSSKLNKHIISRIGGIIFLLMGISFL